MLKDSSRFEYLCQRYEEGGRNRIIIMEAASALFCHYNNTALMIKDKTKWDRAVSPLGVAQIIASLEMNWRDENDAPLDATILRNRYNKVALKWELRKRTSPK